LGDDLALFRHLSLWERLGEGGPKRKTLQRKRTTVRKKGFFLTAVSFTL